jgi:ATP-dependent protease ClpP protease subunit
MHTLLSPADFKNPAILLSGQVNDAMYHSFRKQLDAAPDQALISVEITTLGGDPEVARMMGEDILFHSRWDGGRDFVFLGKTAVYSAGATLMSFFAAENRYLTEGTRLMIHERQNQCEVKLAGPLTGSMDVLMAKVHEMENAIAIQNEGFANLVKGSRVTLEDVIRKARANWYIEAQEAVALGLVRAVI